MTAVDASQIEAFALQLRSTAAVMRLALQAELIRIGTDAKVQINTSHDRPYDTGRLRRSVELSAQPGDVSLWSSVVYSRIWEEGGTVVPNGVPITIPRTKFVGTAIEAAGGEYVDDRLGEVFDTTIA